MQKKQGLVRTAVRLLGFVNRERFRWFTRVPYFMPETAQFCLQSIVFSLFFPIRRRLELDRNPHSLPHSFNHSLSSLPLSHSHYISTFLPRCYRSPLSSAQVAAHLNL